MKSKKIGMIAFVLGGLILTCIGVIATILYAKSYFIDGSGVFDDLQSCIVTCFFIIPIGLYMIGISINLRNTKLITPVHYGDRFICIPLVIFQLIGAGISGYIAIKYDLLFILTFIVLLSVVSFLIFAICNNSTKPGTIISRKSKKFVAITHTHSFYIDGVDVFDVANQIAKINKKIRLYRLKKFVADVDCVYIINGKATQFYVALCQYKSSELVYFVNVKPVLHFLVNDPESLNTNISNNMEFMHEELKNEYKFQNNFAYKIVENDTGFRVTINVILLLPNLDKDLKIINQVTIFSKTCATLEEAEKEIEEFLMYSETR
ncbi:MAG: hypothetical protein J1F31_03620 [Erysipelotrichales bacterium]|nr:hypothetical protein [Erysipelotrichales bacterium]